MWKPSVQLKAKLNLVATMPCEEGAWIPLRADGGKGFSFFFLSIASESGLLCKTSL